MELYYSGDHEEFRPINPVKEFSFSGYVDAIIKMIKGSEQKFSIGIYGEWGTGKTAHNICSVNLYQHRYDNVSSCTCRRYADAER
jgi:hypothetical protein